MGPRRGGLNGRRNAVKPFCHSRRSRVRRGEGYFSGVLRGYRALLASLRSVQYRSSIPIGQISHRFGKYIHLGFSFLLGPFFELKRIVYAPCLGLLAISIEILVNG